MIVLSLFYLLKLTSITNCDMISKIPLAVGDVSICWEDLRRLTLSECRQKLQKLEVGMIEYREALEECGLKNHEEIEKRVSSTTIVTRYPSILVVRSLHLVGGEPSNYFINRQIDHCTPSDGWKVTDGDVL